MENPCYMRWVCQAAEQFGKVLWGVAGYAASLSLYLLFIFKGLSFGWIFCSSKNLIVHFPSPFSLNSHDAVDIYSEPTDPPKLNFKVEPNMEKWVSNPL